MPRSKRCPAPVTHGSRLLRHGFMALASCPPLLRSCGRFGASPSGFCGSSPRLAGQEVRGAVVAADELTRLRGREGWRLIVAGDGEELEALKALAIERKLEDVVEFTGWLGPQGVDELLRKATCAIQPDLATRMNQLSTM